MSTKQNTKNRRNSKAGRFVVMKNDKRLKGEKVRETKRRMSIEPRRDASARKQGESKSAERVSRNSNALQRKTPVRIIPLGGLNEIGKNFTVIECANDMFIIDCGLAFPDSEMLGVDIVIPDFTYVEQNKDRLRGIVLTHGHEDHIGGLPYFLKKVNVPVYGTKLTLGLVEGKLKEHGLLGDVKLNVVEPRQTVKLGCMAVEFIRVNHSIPDAVGMAVKTPTRGGGKKKKRERRRRRLRSHAVGDGLC